MAADCAFTCFSDSPATFFGYSSIQLRSRPWEPSPESYPPCRNSWTGSRGARQPGTFAIIEIGLRDAIVVPGHQFAARQRQSLLQKRWSERGIDDPGLLKLAAAEARSAPMPYVRPSVYRTPSSNRPVKPRPKTLVPPKAVRSRHRRNAARSAVPMMTLMLSLPGMLTVRSWASLMVLAALGDGGPAAAGRHSNRQTIFSPLPESAPDPNRRRRRSPSSRSRLQNICRETS